MRPDDEQIARAEELRRLGENRRARWVERCGMPPFERCRCGSPKLCPKCGRERAARNAMIARQAMDRFHGLPRFVTLTLPSPGPWRLSEGLDALGMAFTALRLRASWKRMVCGGIAGVEPRLGRQQGNWTPHLHAILDSDRDGFSLESVSESWGTLTEDRGAVLVDPMMGLDVISPAAACTYVTKSQDWCPAPGALPLRARELLIRANRGRHVFLRWGSARDRGASGGSPKFAGLRRAGPQAGVMGSHRSD